MSDHQGLKDVFDDARAALHRIFTCIKVKDVRLIDYPESRDVPPPVFDRPLQLNYFLKSYPARIRFVVSPVPVSNFPAIKTRHRHIPGRMNINPRTGGIVDIGAAFQNRVPCDLDDPPMYAIPTRILSSVADLQDAIRIKRTKVIPGLPERIKQVRIHQVDTAPHVRVHSNLDLITGEPLEVDPTPWAELGKDFIIECWDILRREAIEELGHDPGRDLEMAAVYRDIDLSHVERRVYVGKSRKLLTYLHDSPDKHASKSARYAIIIGLVRGTGKVLQVEMPDHDV
jgi:hypothetical protein